MNIFAKNVPVNSTDSQVTKFLKAPLKEIGITVYQVSKLGRSKPNAVILVQTIEAGQKFLHLYGQGVGRAPARRTLFWDGKPVYFTEFDKKPSDLAISTLTYEAAQAQKATASKNVPDARPTTGNVRFAIRGVDCGAWEYVSEPQTSISRLNFVRYSTHPDGGTITIGRRQVIIMLGDVGGRQIRLDIDYHNCKNITVGPQADSSVTFDLYFPPKIYGTSMADIATQLQRLSLGTNGFAPVNEAKKSRRANINAMHGLVTGQCLVYRVNLAQPGVLPAVYSLLQPVKHCSVLSMHISTHIPTEPISRTTVRLNHELSDTARLGGKPFSLLYQIERLSRNGKLSPRVVLSLLPKIQALLSEHGLHTTLYVLRRFYREAPQPGPETEAHESTYAAYSEMLEKLVWDYDPTAPDNPYELTKRHEHINLVHRVVVTPTRTYLAGPEPEPTNRVLRHWRADADNFIRVVFQEEDGSMVRYDSRADQSAIYRERFKGILDSSILIAARGFSFLGFSHSSLRNQSCWFMAPFVINGALQFPPQILKLLGDFSAIRSPARCAARIGQAFTDTNATVNLVSSTVDMLPTVERNGRDFSDGCGTISMALLRRVWKVYGSKKLLKPTALQIRFQGAKGMVSLDTRLDGEKLMLRSNMKKFETELTSVLEVCGAGFRPLPMLLNRQFIKILEDLGVPLKSFQELQNAAVDRLRDMTTSSILTAAFLDETECPKSSGLPSLILSLNEIGIDYHTDPFIYAVVEMAVFSKLRDIKYRGRIPVEQGVTLYGVMDETGFLKEEEIYVVTEKAPEGGRSVLVQKKVIITRSPALHPGDVQIVNAVDVPETSPLRTLRNVVVFSQHGERDLPSKLSGGDLDGDLYNVIYDPRLAPRVTHRPADYPRVKPVELDRPVNSKDMSDFFVKFMETDQLGMISTRHLQIADQEPFGTLDSKCLKLAEMASTAVDFSKTGVPVDMSELPRTREWCKPDFMATDPRVIINQGGFLDIEPDDDPLSQFDEAFEGLDTERPSMRYYFSNKALGVLFRAIDERALLTNMQEYQKDTIRVHQRKQGGAIIKDLVSTVLDYLLHWARQYGVQYEHHFDLARDVRDAYDDTLAEVAHIYEPSPHQPLTEAEIFSGVILGRSGGVQGKPLRNLATTMRQRFTSIVEYATARIRFGDQQVQAAADLDDLYGDGYSDREFEALPRALACLYVAVTEHAQIRQGLGELKSFRYVAAEVALQELRRYQITTLGIRSLPLVTG